MKHGCVSLMRFTACALLTVVLASCTPGVQGVYACEGSILDAIRLESGGKAYVSATMFGQTSEKAGTYTVDGDKVSIVIDGESTVFTLKGKTLDGGGMVGRCTAK
jgi:hypothetical protein